MPIQNSINASNTHFQWTSGTQEVSDRLRQYPIGTTLNLGITYASSTLSVTGSDGTALSSTNPGYVIIASKSSPGQKKIFTVTANQGFIDDTGTSEIIGNLFGLTTGVVASNGLPFYIYAVSNDAEDTVAFMCSRVPHATSSPVLAKIGAPDDAVANTQGSFFSFDSLDETLYDENPCTAIGSFRMTMSALDDWTVQALTSDDGIGMFQEGKSFVVNRGHFGAAAGKFFADNGGTAPDGSAAGFTYSINKDGHYSFKFDSGSIDTVGTGVVTLVFVLPMSQASASIVCSGFLLAGTNTFIHFIASGDASVTATNFYVNDVATGTLSNANIVATNSILLSGTDLISLI